MNETVTLRRTPLHALHLELGAKMVPFAGYDMPVQYPTGVLKEHLHTRASVGLFDVSHMGQGVLTGPSHEATAKALEALTPGDFLSLGVGRQRYTMLLNKDGGIIDDLMVARLPGRHEAIFAFCVVFNASRKEIDSEQVRAHLPSGVQLHMADNRALLALQGPQAEAVMTRYCPDAAKLAFMGIAEVEFDGIQVGVSRSGYTGEDGFEISVRDPDAKRVVRALLAEPEVLPIGLGARDSLRLEAGLCLYGHDIDETTSPVEADLAWAIGKRRREEKNFPGVARIMSELASGPMRKRVGLRPLDRAPARDGTEIVKDGRVIGHVTSGGFGPTVNAPIAMGYVEKQFAKEGMELELIVRGQPRPARVSAMPFVEHRYKRGKT
ncbi:MAG: glycine cleavage system aminomethyltransferase GcvT [Alphaproteobacteria bacterium]